MTEHFDKHLLDNLSDGVYFVDRNRRVTYWNKGAERIAGYTPDDIVGNFCSDNLLRHVDCDGVELCKSMCPLVTCITTGSQVEAEVYCHHKNGHRLPVHVRVAPIRDATGEIEGAVEMFSDISVKMSALSIANAVEQSAFLDELTGLARPGYTTQLLDDMASRHGRVGWGLGVLLLDVDHCQQVNATFGHEVGDRVLRMVADTLRAGSRPSDCAGRWGGELFIVCMQPVDEEGMLRAAGRFRALVEQSDLSHNGATVRVTVSVGAALAGPGETVGDLISRAEQYMYASKQAGRNRVTCANGTYCGTPAGSCEPLWIPPASECA